MKKLFTLFTFLLVVVSSYTQQYDNNWLMGGACITSPEHLVAKLDFGDEELIPELLPDIRFFFNGTNSNISDENGNLLFYTNGNDVFNWKHELIENGDDLADLGNCEEQNLQQGAISIPFPGHENQYILISINEEFILHNEDIQVFERVYFNIVDMNENNGDGRLAVRQDLIIADTLNTGQGMVCQHANGRDWWLLMFEYDSNDYYRFLISPAGIRTFDQKSVDDFVHAGRNQAVYSPDGNYLAHFNTVNTEEGTYVDIFNFDRCNGLLSNQVQIHYNEDAKAGGVSFSPNSRFLYVSSFLNVYQYDLWSSDVEGSRILVAEYDGFAEDDFWTTTFHMAQLAPNDKIYITTPTDGHYLHVIHNPNEKGLACNLEQHALEWPTWKHISIPNFPHYQMGALEGSLCDTLGIVNNPIANFSIEELDSSMTYQFEDLSGEVPTEWSWDFGDGNVSNLQNPTHQYDQFGSYSICLTVSNSVGSNTYCEELCVLPDSKTTNYISASSLVLDCSLENQVVELSSGLSDLNFANEEDWIITWDGPNNFISEGATQISVDQIGIYYLSLEDAISSCIILDSIEIEEGNLALDFSLSQDSVVLECGEFVEIILDIDADCFDVRWEKPNGSLGNTTNSNSFNLTTDGIYIFYVSECGSECETERTLVIERDSMSALFEAEITGRIVLFTPEVIGEQIIHIWKLGDNTISYEENPSHTYEATGTYEVEHEIFDGCNFYISTKEIVIDEDLIAPPSAAFSFNNLNTNFDFQFDDTTTGVVDSWLWEFGDGNTSTMQNPIHTYAQLGSYQVCLTTSNVIGANTICEWVCMLPDPNTNFLSSTDSVLNCVNQGEGIRLSSSLLPADLFNSDVWTISWVSPDGSVISEEEDVIVFDEGLFTFYLEDTVNACAFFDTILIISNFETLDFNISTSANTIPCEGDFELYIDVDEGCYELTIYQADLLLLSSIEDTILLNGTGEYTVALSDCLSGCVNEQFFQIQNESITADWTSEDIDATYIFNSTQTENVNHIWDFGDGIISDEVNPVHTYLESGLYNVTHIVSNACGSDTLIQSINVIISSINLLAEYPIQIFPNPTLNGSVNIGVSNAKSEDKYTIKINSLDGIEVLVDLMKRDTYIFNTANIENGVYVLSIYNDNNELVHIEKLIVIN